MSIGDVNANAQFTTGHNLRICLHYSGVSELSPRGGDSVESAADEYVARSEADQSTTYTDSSARGGGVRTTSSFHSDYTTVPQQSPKRAERGTGGAEQGPRSELGFSPRPESESDSILEEKSISMIALPSTLHAQSAGGSPGRRGSAGENTTTQEADQSLGKQANLKSTGDLSKEAINERYANSKASLQVSQALFTLG